MNNKPPRNTDKELLAEAAAGPKLMPKDYEPDYTDSGRATADAADAAEERAWYKSRGLPIPETYLEGYDPLEKYDDREGWVEDKKFKAVRIISPKNAKYSD